MVVWHEAVNQNASEEYIEAENIFIGSGLGWIILISCRKFFDNFLYFAVRLNV